MAAFESAEVAVETHHFAQMIQLKGLRIAAAKYLQKKTTPADVFIVLDMWLLRCCYRGPTTN
jgi:hypothetical protein